MAAILKEKILQPLEATSIVSRHQHSFVSGRSCLTNLLQSFEEWTKALDEGYRLDVIYLDFRKAFDSVPHGQLIRK